jgi:hypothetical protein
MFFVFYYKIFSPRSPRSLRWKNKTCLALLPFAYSIGASTPHEDLPPNRQLQLQVPPLASHVHSAPLQEQEQLPDLHDAESAGMGNEK